MKYLNENDYIESYGYFLIDEAFNAREMFLEMTEIMCLTKPLDEASIIALNEAALDNLKNFVITIGKRIAEAIGRFISRIEQITGVDRKWLNENQANITKAGVITDATFNNFYRYTNVDTIANTKIADECNQTILEANKDKWADEEGYISTNPTLGIPGFTYNATSGNSLQDQLQSFLRGQREDNVKSDVLTQEVRSRYLAYCLEVFPAAKTTINNDKQTLKNTADNLESYIATKRSQQNVPTQPTETTTTQTTQTTQQTVASGTAASTSPTVNATGATGAANASFEFETSETFFNEVDVKDQNTKGQNTNTTTKVNQQVTGDGAEAKQKDEIAAISKAVRTYYRVNSKKLSAKMNVCTEAYRSRIKLLKWFVKASADRKPAANANNNKQNNAEQQNNAPQNTGNMADAFG